MRGGLQPPAQGAQSPGMSGQISAANSPGEVKKILSTIRAKITGLRGTDPDNPYDPYSSEYAESQAELLDLQAQALEKIADLSIQTTESAARRELAERQAAEARAIAERNNQVRAAIFADMDSVGKDPELSALGLPRPAVELEAEYLRWRRDVAAAYFGGPARSVDEENAALHQLEIKNPDLVKKCQMAGIPAEPSQGVDKYLALIENLEYMDGWRPDPTNPGYKVRLTRYDSATRQEIPVVLPNLATAIKHRKLEAGEYKRQAEQAYQRGAQTFAQALSKRDPAVGELNSPSTVGSSGNSGDDWAARYLENVDEDEALRRYRAGDRLMMDEINKARKQFGMGPIEFAS